MDMSYIMDFAENGLYTTFPNFFSLISADPADLSHIEKNYFFEKITYFWIENVLWKDHQNWHDEKTTVIPCPH